MTLTQLEDSDWGESKIDSPIYKRCFQLRYKKIGAMTAEDFRALVLQQIGLEFIMPGVIKLLKVNPLLEAEYYSGDLLSASLHINHYFYVLHPEYREIMSYLLEEARRKYNTLEEYERDISVDAIEESAMTFLER